MGFFNFKSENSKVRPTTPTQQQEKKVFRDFNISTTSNEEIKKILLILGEGVAKDISQDSIEQAKEKFKKDGGNFEWYIKEIDTSFFIDDKGDIIVRKNEWESIRKLAEKNNIRMFE